MLLTHMLPDNLRTVNFFIPDIKCYHLLTRLQSHLFRNWLLKWNPKSQNESHFFSPPPAKNPLNKTCAREVSLIIFHLFPNHHSHQPSRLSSPRFLIPAADFTCTHSARHRGTCNHRNLLLPWLDGMKTCWLCGLRDTSWWWTTAVPSSAAQRRQELPLHFYCLMLCIIWYMELWMLSHRLWIYK